MATNSSGGEGPAQQKHRAVVVPTTLEKSSRQHFLKWINQALDSKFAAVEQLGGGDVYCLLNNVLFPGSIPLGVIKWNSRREQDSLDNWKHLQLDWKKRGIHKNVPSERLVKGRFQDNYEFLQWYKPFFEANYDGQDFDPVAMRGGAEMPCAGGSAAARTLRLSHSMIRDPTPESGNRFAESAGPKRVTPSGSGGGVRMSHATPQLYAAGRELLGELEKEIGDLRAENDSYRLMCAEIEKLCHTKIANQESIGMANAVMQLADAVAAAQILTGGSGGHFAFPVPVAAVSESPLVAIQQKEEIEIEEKELVVAFTGVTAVGSGQTSKTPASSTPASAKGKRSSSKKPARKEATNGTPIKSCLSKAPVRNWTSDGQEVPHT